MQRSLIAQGIAFGELAGYAQRRIAGSSVIPGDLPARLLLVGLVLFVVSLIVFVALMGLLVLSVLSGRSAQTEPRIAPAHSPFPSDTRRSRSATSISRRSISPPSTPGSRTRMSTPFASHARITQVDTPR